MLRDILRFKCGRCGRPAIPIPGVSYYCPHCGTYRDKVTHEVTTVIF